MAAWEKIDRSKWQKVRKAFLSQFKHLICHYCYEHLTRETVTVDHKIPVSQGGEVYEYSNLLVSCRDCNSIKGNINLTDFMKWKKTVSYKKIKLRREKRKEAKNMSPMEVFFSTKHLTNIEIQRIKTPGLKEEVIQIELHPEKILVKFNGLVSSMREKEFLTLLQSVKLYKPLKKSIKVNVFFKKDHFLFHFKAFKGRLKLFGRVTGGEMVMRVVDCKAKDIAA